MKTGFVANPVDVVRKVNRKLPESLKGCSILLSFSEPQPVHRFECLLRLRLSAEMRKAGEKATFRLKTEQPQFEKRLTCFICGGKLAHGRVEHAYRCVNPRCPAQQCGRQRYVVTGQGVRDFLWMPGMVGKYEPIKLEDFGMRGDVKSAKGIAYRPWLNYVVLRMDRHYDDSVLAAVYFAAADMLAELDIKLDS